VVFVRILVFLAGAAIAVWGLLSAVRTVVLPRGDAPLLAAVVFAGTGRLFRALASERRSYVSRDRVMALYAPVALILLPFVWVATIAVAFTLMFWAVSDLTWTEAFYASGSSVLTLGFVRVQGVVPSIIAFTEAAMGLGVIALLISFLPTIYSAFSRREAAVALLEVRAGSVPSALVLITRYHRIGWLDQIGELWASWEQWFAELEETHTSYAALVFFRSPQPDRSWVTAAGTVLDAASLVNAVVDTPHNPRADLLIRAGFLALRHISDFFGIGYDPNPSPDDPISITREEFDEAVASLQEAGVPLKTDREQAWRDFAGWRVNYDTVLLALADLTMAPYAPWTADRSAPGHHPTKLRTWGSKPRQAIES
jgi:hypothetical protein